MKKSLFFFIFLSFPVFSSQVTEKLLFVGENLEVLTIASRRPESPQRAPAVSWVITEKFLDTYCVRTLGEALSMLPGFYMAKREWGTQPYLRGVPEGILFLYDGVPLTSDSTKSVHPIDEEIDIDSVEKIEVVRGPGSVLWGPDAFVGIVNIVPKKKLKRFSFSMEAGSPFSERKVHLEWGRSFGPWSLSLLFSGSWQDIEPKSYTVLRFVEEGKVVPPEERFGSSTIGRAFFKEAVFSFSYGNLFELSGRLSDYRRPYVMKSPEGDLTWSGRREAPFSFVKVKISKKWDGLVLDFNTYYNNLKFEKKEIDLSQKQRNHILHAEVMVTKELFSKKAVVTAGLSYKKNWVRGAVVSEGGFLPDYLKPENKQFAPHPESKNFDTDLKSVFFQYRHRFKRLDIWFGARFDDHSDYRSTLSYNLGIGWFPSDRIYAKLVFGTAYRTPYSAQILGSLSRKPEKVESVTGELSFSPNYNLRLFVSPFFSVVRNHISEDPFGGYSTPSDRYFLGVEPGVELRFGNFNLWANGLFFSDWGDRDLYRILSYIMISPSGSYKEFFKEWGKDFDSGADYVFNFGFSYKFHKGAFSLKASRTGYKNFSYLRGKEHGSTKPITVFDTSLSIKVKGNMDLSFALKNAFGSRDRIPGTYSPIKLNPTVFYIKLKAEF